METPRSEEKGPVSFTNVWTLGQESPWKGEEGKTILNEMLFVFGRRSRCGRHGSEVFSFSRFIHLIYSFLGEIFIGSFK